MGQCVVQMRGRAGIKLVLDDRQRCAVAQFDQVAQVPGAVAAVLGADKYQVQRRGDGNALFDAQHRAFVGQCGVDPGKHLVAALEAAAEEPCGLVPVLGQQRGQRSQLDTGRQAGQVGQGRGVAAVDEHQPGRRDVGQQGGVDGRRGGRSGREAASFQCAQRRVFPCLVAQAGQAVTQRCLEQRVACLCIGPACGRLRKCNAEGIEQGAHQATLPPADMAVVRSSMRGPVVRKRTSSPSGAMRSFSQA